jgi:hypothetical protein
MNPTRWKTNIENLFAHGIYSLVLDLSKTLSLYVQQPKFSENPPEIHFPQVIQITSILLKRFAAALVSEIT